MPTTHKLRVKQILLRERQNAIQKELTYLVACSEDTPHDERLLLLKDINLKIVELAELDSQIRDITESIQRRTHKNRLDVESSKKSRVASKSNKKKSGKLHALNGKNAPISVFTGVVQGGSVGGGKKR